MMCPRCERRARQHEMARVEVKEVKNKIITYKIVTYKCNWCLCKKDVIE